jgi:hypothetical protein
MLSFDDGPGAEKKENTTATDSNAAITTYFLFMYQSGCNDAGSRIFPFGVKVRKSWRC